MDRTSAFYGLWICYIIGCMAGLMAVSISKPVGTELLQIGTGLATALVGFFAIFNGGGRLLFGVLTDRINPRNTALLTFALIALASLAMWQVPATVVQHHLCRAWLCLGGWLAITDGHSHYWDLIIPGATGWYSRVCAGAIAGPQPFTDRNRDLPGLSRAFVLAIVGFVVARC
jgi:MFS family permease